MIEANGLVGKRRVFVGAVVLVLLVGISPSWAQEVLNVPGVVYLPAGQAARSPLGLPRHPAPSLEAGPTLVLGAMPPLDRRPEDDRLGQRMQVGVHRRVETPTISGRDLDWRDAEGGGQVALVGLRSPGALGLRVSVRAESLPSTAEVRFYAPDEPGTPEVFGRAELGATSTTAPAGEDTGRFWSPAVAGETMVIEVWLPAGSSPDELQLTPDEVAHLYRDVFGPAAASSGLANKDLSGVGSSGSCNRDIACDPRWATTADSVAKYLAVEDGGSFLCSGQLISDVEQSFTPYFLTAAHCVSTRAGARSMTFFWFFQRASCGGADPTEVVQTNVGARLLVTTGPLGQGPDTTLVRLKRPRELPAGVAFSGWSTREAERLQRKRVEGIHHPSGDVKMGSIGKGRGMVEIGEFGDILDSESPTHYEIRWRKGTTEGGSSGSGIWFGRRWPNQYLQGVLTGGFASCSLQDAPDYYGRFDLAFADHPRLRKFLTGSRR